ncbi:MAG: hypothetical protein ACRENJ_06250 [Candidatus Eiseniibacteriota bacterium]
MGKRFLRSIASDFQALTASADITPVELPVNPLSFLLLTIEGTQVDPSGALGDYSYLSDFATGVTDVSVRRLGEQLIQGRLDDLMMLNAFVTGYFPFGEKPDFDTGKVRSMTFLLSFARKPFWHEEALGPTKRGELLFHMTAGALPASFSARRWALEAVELIEDEPTRHLKYTTRTRVMSASGRQQVNLPIGNEILGVLLFDPTAVTTDAASFEWGKVKLLKDNVEQYYPETNWESLMASFGLRGALPLQLGGHRHVRQPVVALEAAGAEQQTDENIQNLSEPPRQYAWLDFDPLMDGSYSLETRGASDLVLDFSADTGAGTVRFLPLELVIPAPGGARP